MKFTPIGLTATCRVDALAPRPAPAIDVQLSGQFKRMGPAHFLIPLHWTPPTETNGELSQYDVCIGTTPLGPTDPFPVIACQFPSSYCFACTKAAVCLSLIHI